jgi:hypothetical protein
VPVVVRYGEGGTERTGKVNGEEDRIERNVDLRRGCRLEAAQGRYRVSRVKCMCDQSIMARPRSQGGFPKK